MAYIIGYPLYLENHEYMDEHILENNNLRERHDYMNIDEEKL